MFVRNLPTFFIQITLLETELDRKKSSLAETEEKLSKLEKEHEGYKVRPIYFSFLIIFQ